MSALVGLQVRAFCVDLPAVRKEAAVNPLLVLARRTVGRIAGRRRRRCPLSASILQIIHMYYVYMPDIESLLHKREFISLQLSSDKLVIVTFFQSLNGRQLLASNIWYNMALLAIRYP